MTEDDLLKYAIEQGIIDYGDIAERAILKKRSEILEKHPYSIWEGKNGFWYTRFRDKNGDLRLKKLKTKKAIEDFIIGSAELTVPTIGDLFRSWISEKVLHEDILPTTQDRYEDDFNRYFDSLKDLKITKVNDRIIQDFVLDAIYKHRLSRKGFDNLRTVCYGIFKYARRKQECNIDIQRVFEELDIPKKAFREIDRPPQQEVFDNTESIILTDYLKNSDNPIELGLLFLFATGIRVGELAALKWSECTNESIYVCRTEVRIPIGNNQYSYEVRESPKTPAARRFVPIPDKYNWILDRMRGLNPAGEYVFMNASGRIRTFTFRKHLSMACDRVGIPRRSLHKIRKTYASILLDNGCSEKMVREIMGHTSIDVTKTFYARRRRTMDEERSILNRISEL